MPTEEQDAIPSGIASSYGAATLTLHAMMILEELEDERRWDESFARSPELLAKLAAEAMAKHRAGKTSELYSEILS